MTTWDDVERRRRLGDRLTLAAGEALPHRLDYLPLARDHLQRLGDVLAELDQLQRAAAQAALRRGDDDALARQVVRERLARGALALEGGNVGCPRRGFRCQFVLGGVGLQILELHLQLVEEPGLAFRARAVELAPELLDLQLQPRDQRVRAAVRGPLPGGGRFGLQTRRALRQDHRMGGGEVARKGIGGVRHTADGITPSPASQAQMFIPSRWGANSAAASANRCLRADSRVGPA